MPCAVLTMPWIWFGAARIKVFLYVLVRDLEFSIDPAVEIEKKVKCVPPSLPFRALEVHSD